MTDYYNEFTRHLMNDIKPSVYFEELKNKKEFPLSEPFGVLLELEKIDQELKHHPEGNVWNHTMQVVDQAASRKEESINPEGFMWAALLHDIGKITTTRRRHGWITAYNHDKAGAEMTEDFLGKCNIDRNSEFFKYVVYMVRLHMQILFVVKNNEFVDYNLIMKSGYYNDIALLGICDRLGRGLKSKEDIQKEYDNIRIFKERCKAYEDRMRRIQEKYMANEKINKKYK